MQCEKRLWLEYHHPELATPYSPAQMRIFRQGTEVGEYARSLYSDGILIEADHRHIPEALEDTGKHIQAGARALFEPAFIFARTLVRVDILEQSQANNAWDIIEVKSTTSVHDEHLWDLAVQRYVLEGSGLPINQAFLMHINTSATFPDLQEILIAEDVTEKLPDHIAEVPGNLEHFFRIIESDSTPTVGIGSRCDKPYDCPFKNHCWAHVPEASIFSIPRLNASKADILVARNILALADLPADFTLSESQQEYVDMYKRQEKRIDYKEIDSLLGSLIYPIHFLDFETDNPAIPRFAGMHPFERIPFQFSVHVLEKDGMLIHQEFLHTDNTDPREAIAKSLVTDIRPIGSIVAYNASFEQGVIKELATTVPELSEPLLSFLPRFFDLLIVFRNHYKDPAFLGSNSIKSVLPVLVPELSYKDLQVRNGGDAQVTWNEMILEPDPVRKQELAQALREYCQLDTFAMVRLFQKLFKTVTSSMAGIIDISE